MPRLQNTPAYSLASLVIEPDDYIYLKQMRSILDSYPNIGPPEEATQLTKHLYIGNLKNADNVERLRQNGITHVLNVAGTRNFDLTRSPYSRSAGIVKYLMIPAEDYSEYNIMYHFQDAFTFLDKCKTSGGKALVHCNLGINRSGAICAAYLMLDQHMPLLEVASLLKKTRGVVLTNKGFRRQLIRFARARGYLDVPKYLPSSGSLKFGTDRTNTIKVSQYPDYGRPQTRAASTDALHTLRNGKEYGHGLMNGYSGEDMDISTQTLVRHSKPYSSLPRNMSISTTAYENKSTINNKRPIATSHYNPEYFMDTIPEDLAPARSGRNKSQRNPSSSPRNLRKVAPPSPSPSRSMSKFGVKSQKEFKKSKSRSVSSDSAISCNNGVHSNSLGDTSLSTSRPLRVYKRSVTDTEIYKKPSVSHTYKRADTVATTDIASGLERLSLVEKSSSIPSGLSKGHRTTSRLSLSSSIFNRFRSDNWKKS